VTLEVSVTVGGGVPTVLVKVLHTIQFADSVRVEQYLYALCRLVLFRRVLTRISLKGMLEVGNSVR
jgi:hypothetical protein